MKHVLARFHFDRNGDPVFIRPLPQHADVLFFDFHTVSPKPSTVIHWTKSGGLIRSRLIIHLDIFSGIGGFALATEMVWENVEHIFCDNDLFCQAVLRKHWPQSKIYDDIRQLQGGDIGTVDLVTGGFPCQPFSSAGQRRGKEDDRWLWPDMLRLVTETRPTWVIGENVVGIVKMELDGCISDLESVGYAVQAFIIPAVSVNAPHRRDRVFLIANAEDVRDSRRPNRFQKTEGGSKWDGIPEPSDAAYLHASHANNNGKGSEPQQEHGIFETGAGAFSEAWETRQSLLPSSVLCRTDDGIPNRMDRTKALGNAIVPAVAAEIMRAIKSVDESMV